ISTRPSLHYHLLYTTISTLPSSLHYNNPSQLLHQHHYITQFYNCTITPLLHHYYTTITPLLHHHSYTIPSPLLHHYYNTTTIISTPNYTTPPQLLHNYCTPLLLRHFYYTTAKTRLL